MERRAFVFTGRVQGVGFRVTARHFARDLGVTGWVRNEADGSVRLEAQGTLDEVQGLASRLREHFGRNVESVRGMPQTPRDDEDGFTIRR